MSLERFDEALKKKLKSVYPNVMFSSLSKVLENSVDTEVKSQTHDGINRDKEKKEKIVSLPLIAFDRINNPFNFEYAANDPSIRRGRFVIQDEELITREKVLPINIQYQIDIVSDRRVEVDGIWRELSMYLYTKGILKVDYKFGDEVVTQEYPIKLMDTDNTTDVEEFTDKGRIYRQTINVEIPNAKLLFIESVDLIEEFPVRIINLEENDDVQD